MQTQSRFFRIVDNYKLLILMLIIILLMLFMAPNFFNPFNLINILANLSINGIAAMGIMLLMIGGKIDISIGSMMVLAGAISIISVNHLGPTAAVLIGVASGVVMGLVNGILVAKLKINAFIATLGTMVIYQGITYSITNLRPVSTSNQAFQDFAVAEIGGFPVLIFYFILAVIVLWFITRFTQLGKNAYAIGGNSEACCQVGIRVDFYVIVFFIISGIFAAFAGVLLSGKIQAASAVFGEKNELLVIASVVLGGVHLRGGVGKVIGVVQGIIILGIIDNITVFLGLIGYYQMFFRAIILIAVLVMDVQSVKQARKRLEQAEIRLIKNQKQSKEEVQKA